MRIGQTVVCINDEGQGLDSGLMPFYILIRNRTYVIEALRQGCCCLLVNVGLPPEGTGETHCSECNKVFTGRWHDAVRFVPYEPLKDELDRLEEECLELEEVG